jgi:hypothetical protein
MNNRRASPAVSTKFFVVCLILLIQHCQNIQIAYNAKDAVEFSSKSSLFTAAASRRY